MQKDIQALIHSNSKMTRDPAGRETRVLEDGLVLKIARECDCKVHDVYLEALKLGVCPFRYLRNADAISLKEQIRLAESRVAVIGAGGLGGHVILLLARLGIGHLVVVDQDVFDETNLNRQALCSEKALGKSKAEEAASIVRSINPGVDITFHQAKIALSNAEEILTGSDVVVDALDNIPDRLVLEEVCKKLGIPLVHGAVAGFEGQVMTIFPDDSGLKNLYGKKRSNENRSKSPESILGVPSPTPSIIATLQTMEVLKIILKRGKIFRNIMLHVDIETGQMNEFVFKS